MNSRYLRFRGRPPQLARTVVLLIRRPSPQRVRSLCAVLLGKGGGWAGESCF